MCVSRIFLPRGDCVLLLLGRKPGHPERRGGTTKIRVEEFQGEVSIEEGSGQKDVPFSSHYYRSLFRNRERENVQKSTSRVIVSRWRGEKKGRKKEKRKVNGPKALDLPAVRAKRSVVESIPSAIGFRRVSGTLHETLRKSGQVFEEAGGRLAIGGRSTSRKEATDRIRLGEQNRYDAAARPIRTRSLKNKTNSDEQIVRPIPRVRDFEHCFPAATFLHGT